MKFVCYYRVSKRIGQDYGIDAQKETVRRYLGTFQGSAEVIGEFEEKESGKDSENRPQLLAAISLAQSSGARLCIGRLDRLSRNAAFLLTLQNSGCDFVCCDMPNACRMTIGIMALVAQRERELISERTKAGLAVAKARGVALGNPNAGQAWKIALARIGERKTAFAVSALKSIEEIKSTGISSLNRIADCLNKRGEKTPRGGRWTHKTVARVLAAAKG